MTAPFIPPAAADDARVALTPRTPGLLAALLEHRRMGAASPGNLPLDRGSVPVGAQDLSQIAGPIAHAFYVGSGMKAGTDAGRALSSGRGFDRLGGKQPIAGPLLTAAMAAAPIATGEAGPMLRAIGGEVSAGAKALAPEFASALGDAMSHARLENLEARDYLASLARERNVPTGPFDIRTSAARAAPGKGYIPSRMVPPDPVALRAMEIPFTPPKR